MVFVTYSYFLGLRTLTVIQDAVNLVNKNLPEGNKLDIDAIDYDDAKVYELISSGKNEGIFQLESAGMKNFMKELKPGNIEDVIAGIALYRPGPMDFIPKYVKGKQNPSEIVYDCPELEPILEQTYGCIIYQEQVMQIVRDLAGYSYGRSDLVRRAMSKKKVAVMEKERKNFVYGNIEEGVKGCIANGIKEEVAHKIYDEMIDFAKYAFNKSHAAAYAIISYQTAFLKCYYPIEFMAALMTSVMDNPRKVAEYIYTCRQMGISILAPDINRGESAFSVDNGKIRYGLSAIKGLGKPVIQVLVAEREKNGVFTSLRDFAERLSGKEVNKRTIESFIKSGAFDGLGATRKQMMSVYSALLDDINQERKKTMTGQMSLFDFFEEEDKTSFLCNMPNVGEFSKEELLSYEKEVLGVYLSGHPLEAYEKLLAKNITAITTDFELEEETGESKKVDGEVVCIGGMITEITRKTTRTNSMMVFLTLEDLVGTVEVIVFPKDYEKNKEYIREDNKVFLKGRVSTDGERAAKLICSECIPFEQVPKELWIRYADKDTFLKEEPWLYEMLGKYKGKNEVIIYCEKEKIMKRLSKKYGILVQNALLVTLYEKYGKEYVKVVEKSIEK